MEFMLVVLDGWGEMGLKSLKDEKIWQYENNSDGNWSPKAMVLCKVP